MRRRGKAPPIVLLPLPLTGCCTGVQDAHVLTWRVQNGATASAMHWPACPEAGMYWPAGPRAAPAGGPWGRTGRWNPASAPHWPACPGILASRRLSRVTAPSGISAPSPPIRPNDQGLTHVSGVPNSLLSPYPQEGISALKRASELHP